MKKLRILSLCAIVLCLAMLFAACGGEAKNLGVKKIFDEIKADADETPQLKTATKLDVKGSYYNNDGILALFGENVDGHDSYTVYNVATGRAVGTYTETDKITYIVDLNSGNAAGYDINYYVVYTTTADDEGKETFQTALYAADGTKVVEVNNPTPRYELRFDLLRFDNKCYRVSENGAIAEAFAWTDFAGNMPNIFAATEKYYYARLASGTGFVVLDKSLQPVSSYRFPSYAQNPVYGVLNNGNVWLQYNEKLPADAEKYDFLLNESNLANKYTMHQQIFNAKKGTTKDVKTEYYIVSAVGREVAPLNDQFATLDKKIVNIAAAYKIEDKRVSTNAQEMLYVSLSNKGEVQSVINRFVEGQVGFVEVPVDGVMLIADVMNRQYLYDAKGNLIGEITGTVGATDTYVVGTSKIYDYNLSVVYDYAAENYEYVRAFNSSVLFSKDNSEGVTEYYLFANGSMTKISEGLTKVYNHVNDRVYMIADIEAGTCTYYNDLGEKLLELKASVNNLTSTDNEAYLVSYLNPETSEMEYYRFG